MGSRNAFSEHKDKRLHHTSGAFEDRSPKRPRLADDAVASIYNQGSNADTSLEVDHMILDYVAYQTVETCLSSRNPAQRHGPFQNVASNLAMCDSFVSIFKARHPAYRPDPELCLRLLLLRLVTLFAQRLTANPTTPSKDALRALRDSNQKRAREWIGDASRVPSMSFDTGAFDQYLPVDEQSLERNRAHVLQKLGVPAEDDHYEDAFYGTSTCVSLSDLIPLFMQATAARNAMSESSLTVRWMQLASELMLQACLEQYLAFGAQGTDAIDEAFAWGYKAVERSNSIESNGVGDSSTTEDEVNSMFEDEDYEVEVEEWKSMKASALKLLLSPDPENEPVARLETIAAQRTIETFEMQLLAYLSGLSESIPKPVLVQLESGQLEGMTHQQTSDFLAECGIGVTDLSSC